MNKSENIGEHANEIILESISDGVFTVDHHWKIMSFNRAAEEITGISREEAIGRHCWEVFRSNMCEANCALKRTMQENKSFASTSTYIINSHKKRIPITVSTSPLIDAQGDILGGVEIFRDHSLVEELRREISAQFQVGDMVSSSLSMKRIFNILPQIAESDSTVLISGETGTGKELMARAIHDLSHRKGYPFVGINCGALPDTLLESELFGYKAGAFTHAVKDKPGHFTVAKGGTILLDEIGDTSAAFQVKLLRVLEEREYQPLGSIKSEPADVRIIAATNKNLDKLALKGGFREDLFYRINVIRIHLPPLRERMEDIPYLIERFITKLNRIQGKSVRSIGDKELEVLMTHSFPGNIRELENIIEHAFVLCASGNIELNHLPSSLWSHAEDLSLINYSGNPVKSAEKIMILDALKSHGYHRKAAADSLGMHKSTLQRKIKRLELNLPEIDGRMKK